MALLEEQMKEADKEEKLRAKQNEELTKFTLKLIRPDHAKKQVRK